MNTLNLNFWNFVTIFFKCLSLFLTISLDPLTVEQRTVRQKLKNTSQLLDDIEWEMNRCTYSVNFLAPYVHGLWYKFLSRRKKFVRRPPADPNIANHMYHLLIHEICDIWDDQVLIIKFQMCNNKTMFCYCYFIYKNYFIELSKTQATQQQLARQNLVLHVGDWITSCTLQHVGHWIQNTTRRYYAIMLRPSHGWPKFLLRF